MGVIPGTKLGSYEIESLIGAGGMGEVYRARDTELNRLVAIKVLPDLFTNDGERLARFNREARILASLNHPHICTLYAVGEQDGRQFMVMELLTGESLKDRIAAGPLAIGEALEFAVQIADALDAAHAAGVIHRDINPANLFITRRSQVKVLDFGIAKLIASRATEHGALAHTTTLSSTAGSSTIGTLMYLSPEQARAQEIDARTDLFSFGAVLYEMATGTPAFGGVTPAIVFEGILTKQPSPPSRVNTKMPPELDGIIAKALEKDRETRYQSAAEMSADLARIKRQLDTEARFDTTTTRAEAAAIRLGGASAPAYRARDTTASATRSGRRGILVGAPLAMLALVAGLLLWQSQRTPALAARDTVILGDFRNRTGDPVFDDTLAEALAVQLRQSPYLNVLADQQVQMTLRQMGRAPSERLTSEIAREVCVRSSAKALLGGTIANIGNSYLLTLAAEDCVTGEILAEEQVSSTGKDGVIVALGDAAAAFRERLGESLASVQRFDQKIEQATTSSLEALKAYSQGMATRRTQGDHDSLPFFRQAVKLDPQFGLAHARLGTVLANLGQPTEAVKAATRAYELRDKVSQRERLYIEARYHTTVVQNLDDAIEAYRLLLATYPDDYAAHSNLGSLYRERDRLNEALHHLENAVRLAPAQPLGRLNLAYAYLDDGRITDARQQFEEALKLQDSMSPRTGLVIVGTITGDQLLVDAQIAASKGHRGEVDMVAIRAQAAEYKGQMREAARLAAEVFRLAGDLGRLENAAEGLLAFAIAQALTGRADQARIEMRRVLDAGPIPDNATDELLAFAAVLGDRGLVRRYYDRAVNRAKVISAPTEVAKSERAMRALAALGEGRNGEAYALATANGAEYRQRNAVFTAGLAALRLERWTEAASAFQTIVGFGIRLGLTATLPVSHIMLARAHAGAGRMSDARKSYDEAFRIWKDADPDLPLLVESRREYQRLPQ